MYNRFVFLSGLIAILLSTGCTSLHTIEHIDASPDAVWNVLTNFEDHRHWNPMMNISGIPERSHQLQITMKNDDQSEGQKFRPIVINSEPNHELRWLGRLGLPGLFDGEHFFTLERTNRNTTIFHHGEYFSGLLVPLIKPGKYEPKFRLFNAALKNRVEQNLHGRFPGK